MEWESYPRNLPNETGPYIVSLQGRAKQGIIVSNYSAYYDKESRKWFKYDPFVDNFEPVEEITQMVTA